MGNSAQRHILALRLANFNAPVAKRPKAGASALAIAMFVGGDGAPRLPGDPQNYRGDREPDDRIRDLHTRTDDHRRRDHTERNEAVDPRVMTVGDEGGAVEPGAGPEADSSRDLV